MFGMLVPFLKGLIMSNNWDEDYNVASLTAEQRAIIQAEQNIRRIREDRELRGYIEIPALSEEIIRRNFSTLTSEDWNSRHESVFAPWNANRMMWICHACGAFGFKSGLRETFKCYHYSYRSRNVTVCRAGEISLHIRGILNQRPGVNMIDVFESRKQRLKDKRKKVGIQDESTLSLL